MDSSRTSLASRTSSGLRSSPSPLGAPTNDDIEAVIQMATSARPSPDGRLGPPRDTRTQLFVGNLPYRVRWQDLKDLFRKAGTVLRADVSLGPDNRSRGYGTVMLATAEDAGRAVDMFNGYSWQTRILEVRPDRLPLSDFENPIGTVPGPSTSTFAPSTSFQTPLLSNSAPMSMSSISEELDLSSLLGHDILFGSSTGSCRNLFVGNLPFHCQWQDLKDLFRQAGTIMRADVALGQDGRSRGFGTVVFATEHDAERAVKMFNGYEYNGRALKVHYDKFSQHSSQPTTTAASPALPNHGTYMSGSAASASTTSSLNTPLFGGFLSSNSSQLSLPRGFQLDFGPPSPSSPFDRYHSPMQASMQQQREQQQQQSSRSYHHGQSSVEMDELTSSLKSTHVSSLSSVASTSNPSSSSKPSLSTKTSSNSNTSSTSVSKSSEKSSNSSSHQHPHHPGPISLPPPPQVHSFPMSHHHPVSPHGLQMSPLHHPLQASPLHHPSHLHHMIPSTPHGLPPITPSMPPFNFLPQMSPHHHPSQTSDASDPNHYFQLAQRFSDPASAPQQRPSTLTFVPMYPLPSPTVSSHPNSPLHHPAATHVHHAYIPQPLSTFSPGVAMSPGAVWHGRPGGQNAFINPAVGAPVHIHSPGHGGFFYPMASPGHTAHEPAGYFDPVYFPPTSTANPLGASGLANEILKDKKESIGVSAWGSDEKDRGRREREEGEVVESSPSEFEEIDGSEEAAEERARRHSTSTATSWHSSDGELRTWEGREKLDAVPAGRDVAEVKGHDSRWLLVNDGVGHSRTHSMSNSKKPTEIFLPRSESDPLTTTIEAASQYASAQNVRTPSGNGAMGALGSTSLSTSPSRSPFSKH